MGPQPTPHNLFFQWRKCRIPVKTMAIPSRLAAAITSAAESVEASREALAAVLDLYRAGRSPALEVLTAQLELVRSEAARVQALGDHAVARARVVRRAGT